MNKIGNTAYLQYASGISDITDIGNPSFARASLLVCYTGRNRNGSYISREAIEAAIPSMFNCPVVCNYDIDTDTIGGHDVKYTTDDKGAIIMLNLTDGVGVVPESAKWDFISKKDGEVEHEYLRVDILLYKRSAVYQKIERDGICAESMEINIGAGHVRDEGDYSIDNFNFEAFCLLGEDVTPCFESASVRLFTQDSFAENMRRMMEDYKAEFASATKTNEGGKCQMDINSILAEFNLDVGQLDFDYSNMSAEEVKSEIQKGIDEGKYAINMSDITEGVREALASIETITEYDPWDGEEYEIPRYMLADINLTDSEVIVYDRKDDWHLYGLKYSMSGDSVVIDATEPKRKKIEYVDFNEGDAAQFSVSAVLENEVKNSVERHDKKAEEKFNAEKASITSELEKANAEIVRLTGEVDELARYKADNLAKEHKEKVEEIFNQFSDLSESEAFIELRNTYGDMPLEAIEEKCYAIRGRLGSKFSYDDKAKVPRLSVDNPGDDRVESPYGGIVEKYKNKHSR